ncbi:hypothetical protein SAMN02745244_03678 [Tessaracoccus bendigoensis DSM 12906]|uniref:DUF559 domain-containing protein n=2 Tax=Tessaracoccus TaxID=72763 RepID=A0A1M6NNA7_9ACTN|nr:hypothetical protein SAMN02745244_03678 [Tessaracoccus bendigoensis DSM 12906]
MRGSSGVSLWRMLSRTPLPDAVTRLIRDQCGVVMIAQLLDGGLTRQVCRRLTASWARIAPGLYIDGSVSFESAAWAGVLRAGPGGVVGADAAAYLNGVLRDPPAEVIVWSPSTPRPFAVEGWRVTFRRGRRVGRGSPPRLSVEACLVDLARDHDEVGVVDAVARALAQRRTTPERLLAAVSDRERVRHARTIKDLCAAAGAGIESGLEWLFQRNVVAWHRLPVPRRQASTQEGGVDGFYDEWGVIVELDGMRDHCDWSKDMLRDNAHAVRMDAVTLRYGWNAVTRQPCEVAGQVADALALRGWKGRVRRCRRCRPR